MREITQDVAYTKALVKRIAGQQIKIKVNRGRNKTELLRGSVEDTYPQIFTFRKTDGELNSFSYADILSKTVRFLK